MNTKIKLIFLSLFFIISISGQLNSQSNQKFKIIINKSNKLNSIESDELKKIFLKKITKWDNEEKIYPVDLNESSKTRQYFTDEIHGKKVSAIKAYWQKQIFTGRGVPPPEKSSEKEVMEYVEKYEGAIGYISTNKSISEYDIKIISFEE